MHASCMQLEVDKLCLLERSIIACHIEYWDINTVDIVHNSERIIATEVALHKYNNICNCAGTHKIIKHLNRIRINSNTVAMRDNNA